MLIRNKRIAIILVTVMMVSIITASISAAALSDINTHWAKSNIEYLVSKGCISGYNDGTFKPDNTITVAEFTKIFLISQGTNSGNSQTGYWADNYIKSATQKGYIKSGEFDDVTRNITRGEIARMIVRALPNSYPTNLNDYAKQISDYNSTPDAFKEYVLKAYVTGIVTGRPDGGFYFADSATRAEASTMIVRLVDDSKRIVPELREPTPTPTFKPKISPEVENYPVAKALTEIDGLTSAVLYNGAFTFLYGEINPYNKNALNGVMDVSFLANPTSENSMVLRVTAERYSSTNMVRLKKILEITVPDMAEEIYNLSLERMGGQGEEYYNKKYHNDYTLYIWHLNTVSLWPKEEQGICFTVTRNLR